MSYPSKLPFLLFQMQQRLGMYITPPTLPSLMNFISGYSMAINLHNINEPDTLQSFHSFVAQQLGYTESTAGWANMILAHVCGLKPNSFDWQDFLSQPISEQQHAQSINLFYKLLKKHYSFL